MMKIAREHTSISFLEAMQWAQQGSDIQSDVSKNVYTSSSLSPIWVGFHYCGFQSQGMRKEEIDGLWTVLSQKK